MRVKLFSHRSVQELENEINAFLQTLQESSVIDIKYSSSNEWSEAMIIYRID